MGTPSTAAGSQACDHCGLCAGGQLPQPLPRFGQPLGQGPPPEIDQPQPQPSPPQVPFFVSEKVMRVERRILRMLAVDPLPNSDEELHSPIWPEWVVFALQSMIINCL